MYNLHGCYLTKLFRAPKIKEVMYLLHSIRLTVHWGRLKCLCGCTAEEWGSSFHMRMILRAWFSKFVNRGKLWAKVGSDFLIVFIAFQLEHSKFFLNFRLLVYKLFLHWGYFAGRGKRETDCIELGTDLANTYNVSWTETIFVCKKS